MERVQFVGSSKNSVFGIGSSSYGRDNVDTICNAIEMMPKRATHRMKRSMRGPDRSRPHERNLRARPGSQAIQSEIARKNAKNRDVTIASK